MPRTNVPKIIEAQMVVIETCKRSKVDHETILLALGISRTTLYDRRVKAKALVAQHRRRAGD